jgi:hypothetical protein
LAVIRARPPYVDNPAVSFTGKGGGVGVGHYEGIFNGWSADEFCILKISILSFYHWLLMFSIRTFHDLLWQAIVDRLFRGTH